MLLHIAFDVHAKGVRGEVGISAQRFGHCTPVCLLFFLPTEYADRGPLKYIAAPV
jgi:hypothetical protein